MASEITQIRGSIDQNKQAENETGDPDQSPSKCGGVGSVDTSNSKSKTIDLLQEATIYVESVMASQKVTAILRTPLPSCRKRTLSAPSAGESANKKLKNVSPGTSGITSENETEVDQDTCKSKTDGRNKITARRNLVAKSRKDACNSSSKGNSVKSVKTPKTPKSAKLPKNRKITKPKKGNSPEDRKQENNYVLKEKVPLENRDSAECELTSGNSKQEKTSIPNEVKDHTGTSVILEAMTQMRKSLEGKIDNIDRSNKDALRKIQIQFDNIRSEFNQRIEGLTKKVESNIKKSIDNTIDVKVKAQIARQREETNKLIQKNEKNIKRLEQTVISTVKEEVGDEIDSLAERVKYIESRMKEGNETARDDS